MNAWIRKFVVLPAAVLAGCAILYFGGREGLEELKKWQAGRLAALSGNYADQGKLQEAAMSANTALRLHPTQPEASRFMAGLMEADGRYDQAMELYGRLYNSGSGNLEDLKKQAINAARGKYMDPARWLASNVAEKGEPEFPLLLQAEIQVGKGEIEAARQSIRDAVAIRNSRSALAALMFFQLQYPSDNSARELLEHIWELKDGDDDFALRALTTGLSSNILTPEQRLEFLAKIRAHPKSTERELLLADTIEVSIDPSTKPRVIGNLLARLKKSPTADRVLAANWLNSIGQPREALILLPVEDAFATPEAQRTWIDSVAAIGEWNSIIKALENKNLLLPGHIAAVYKARSLKMAGRPAEADAAYRKALADFAAQPQETAQILDYIHRSGEYAIFDEGLQVQLQKPGTAFDMMILLMPTLLDARDSARVRNVIALALASPNLADNPSLLNDAAYLDLVLGRPVDAAAIAARHRDNPSDPASRFNLVFERLRSGQNLEALALLEETFPDKRQLAPNHLFILASVLAANGRGEEALQTASRIPATRISAQELEILKQYLTQPAR